jgi:hypothetical protein
VPNDVTTPVQMTVLAPTPADAVLPGTDTLILSTLLETRASPTTTAFADSVSAESAAFATVFEADAGLAETSAETPAGDGSAAASRGGSAPQGQASDSGKPRQEVPPAVSPVVPVLSGLVGEIQNSAYQSGSATPGLGAGAVTGTARFMP